MSDASIVCSNLSFSWPDDTPVFQDLSFTVGRRPHRPGRAERRRQEHPAQADRRRAAAQRRAACPSTGVLGYLPQTLPLAGDLTVAEVLGVAAVIDGAGTPSSPATPSEEHFTTIGNDWDIEERTRAQLDRLGLGDAPARPAAAHPQRRPGRLPRPGGPAAEAARRPAARRADQQPRPRRPPQALRACWRTGPAACCWSATTGRCSTAWTASPNSSRARSAPTAANFTAYDEAVRGGAGGRREEHPQRRAGGQAREAGDAAGPRAGRAPGQQRRPQPRRTPACRRSSPAR